MPATWLLCSSAAKASLSIGLTCLQLSLHQALSTGKKIAALSAAKDIFLPDTATSTAN